MSSSSYATRSLEAVTCQLLTLHIGLLQMPCRSLARVILQETEAVNQWPKFSGTYP